MNIVKELTVDYITHSGDDLLVVNAARVSMDKHKDVYDESDTKLINYLATHNHFTPFTHPQITLREEVPIFVARQRFKHMVGFTYNEVSRRYVSTEPSIYMPPSWRYKPEKNIKQGSGGDMRADTNSLVNSLVISSLDKALMTYDSLLECEVAPEQARMVLPQNMMTSYYVTGSLAAFARAYKLRISEDSQKEIQELAKKWNEIISKLYPVSWAALIM
ncbi:Thymidylate synthase thyX [Oligella urethralis]|uniref:FAD-dependent thymidylate synthase n=1 Tax=Oligella urethralis TaxID=90245 RepID=UPI000E01F6FE|nr:FAD-dependent thymidylate synthase [Oligella urethralis]SUA63237.1 Thymidylate synthase thyX [Oligella urethralis]